MRSSRVFFISRFNEWRRGGQRAGIHIGQTGLSGGNGGARARPRCSTPRRKRLRSAFACPPFTRSVAVIKLPNAVDSTARSLFRRVLLQAIVTREVVYLSTTQPREFLPSSSSSFGQRQREACSNPVGSLFTRIFSRRPYVDPDRGQCPLDVSVPSTSTSQRVDETVKDAEVVDRKTTNVDVRPPVGALNNGTKACKSLSSLVRNDSQQPPGSGVIDSAPLV